MSRQGIAITTMPRSKGVGWYGDGSLGDVTISQTTTLSVAEDSGQLITQYRNLTINAGATLKPSNRCNGWVLLVQNDLTINGTLSMSKMAPCQNSNETTALQQKHIALTCNGLTGGNAGEAGTGRVYSSRVSSTRESTTNGTPGNGFALGGGFGPGGGGVVNHGTSYAGGSSEPRPVAGTLPSSAESQTASSNGAGGSAFHYGTGNPRGGNGPGGAGAALGYYNGTGTEWYGDQQNGAAGDAYPGGLLVIFVGGQLKVGNYGSIASDGGAGASSTYYKSDEGFELSTTPGGGAGGGIIVIVHGPLSPIYTASKIHANGGAGGAAAGTNDRSKSTAGSAGSNGTVVVAPISNYIS